MDLAPLELLGLFVGPVAVGAWLTLRERAMLGDTGANLIGAMIGIWLVTTLGARDADGARRLIVIYGVRGVPLDLRGDRARFRSSSD